MLGPSLPGFTDVDTSVDGRFYHMWARYESWNNLSFINTYLENVGQLLKESQSPRYRDVTLIYRKHIIQAPEEVATTGKMSVAESREWWLPREAWPD